MVVVVAMVMAMVMAVFTFMVMVVSAALVPPWGAWMTLPTLHTTGQAQAVARRRPTTWGTRSVWLAPQHGQVLVQAHVQVQAQVQAQVLVQAQVREPKAEAEPAPQAGPEAIAPVRCGVVASCLIVPSAATVCVIPRAHQPLVIATASAACTPTTRHHRR